MSHLEPIADELEAVRQILFVSVERDQNDIYDDEK
jgi:hypothetical protein